MTQVKEMTNTELNRKLALLMGWQAGGDPNKKRDFVWWIDDNRFRLPEEWSPCSDPAASLEVEQAAIKADAAGYMRNLVAVKWGRQDSAELTELSLVGAADLHTATPRERAEAAYQTLSGEH